MRKRFVIETLHLDAEGGVSERRTEPVGGLASVTTTNLKTQPTVYKEHAEPIPNERLAQVAIDEPKRDAVPVDADNKPKKARKKVAFQSADSTLYDF